MATNARAKVTVTFIDDTETEYFISGDKGVATGVPAMLQQRGVISLWNDEESYIIMGNRVQDMTFVDLTEAEREACSGPRPDHSGSRRAFERIVEAVG